MLDRQRLLHERQDPLHAHDNQLQMQLQAMSDYYNNLRDDPPNPFLDPKVEMNCREQVLLDRYDVEKGLVKFYKDGDELIKQQMEFVQDQLEAGRAKEEFEDKNGKFERREEADVS